MTSENHLVAALRASSAGRAEAVFARSANGAMLSYGDFFAGAEKIAAALVGLGVQPGDRMAVQIDKSLEALQLYVGAVMAGGVFLPLNTGYTAAEVAYFLTDAAPTVAVCDPSRHGDLAPIATKAGVVFIAGEEVGDNSAGEHIVYKHQEPLRCNLPVCHHKGVRRSRLHRSLFVELLQINL